MGRQLYDFLTDDRALDAFAYEHYPEVRRRFQPGMDRAQKIKLLLQHEEAPRLVARLRQAALVPQGGFEPPPDTEPPPPSRRGMDPVLAALYLDSDDRPLLGSHGAQEEALLQAVSAPENRAIFVTGGHLRGLSYFCLRTLRSLALQRLGKIVEVRWDRGPPFPRSRNGCLEALTLALGCTLGELGQVLQGRLTYRNLILFHPLLHGVAGAEGLVPYYSEWLPELLGRVRAPHQLFCVQPIEWHEAGPLRRLSALLLRGLLPVETEFGARLAQRHDAEAALLRLQEAGNARLRPWVLPPLADPAPTAAPVTALPKEVQAP